MAYTGEQMTKFEPPPSILDERQKRGLDALDKVIFYSTATPTAPISHQRTIFDMDGRTKSSASMGPRSHTRSMLKTPAAPWSHINKKPNIKPSVKPTKPKSKSVYNNVTSDSSPTQLDRGRKSPILKHNGRVSPKYQTIRQSPTSSSASSLEARDLALPQQIVTPALPQQIVTPRGPMDIEETVPRQSSPISPTSTTSSLSYGKLLPRRTNMRVPPTNRIYKSPHRSDVTNGTNAVISMSSIELYDVDDSRT